MLVIKRLETITDDQLNSVADLCVRAFDGDVAQKAILGGDWGLHHVYFRAHAWATVLEGELYIVQDEDTGEIVSTASWFGNGKVLFESEAQRGVDYQEFFNNLSEGAKHWHSHTYPEVVNKLDARLFTSEERNSRWWCFNLATEPKHQGKGFATSLMRVFFKKGVETKTVVGLAAATDENAAKYLHMGFRERGGVNFPAPTGDFYIHLLSRDT